jgi:3-deoxy-manno-octulosonate cytidylyltransferase (CMP-KDO synthetase)
MLPCGREIFSGSRKLSATIDRSPPHVKIVAIIPARYGSQRLPGKPLALIAGRPMIEHVVRQTQKTPRVAEVIVATDDERIAAAVRAFGGRAVMTVPSLASGTDRVAAVAESMPDVDIVVNVQGDEPMIAPAMIDRAIEPLELDDSLVAATCVRKITSGAELIDPGVVKVVLDGSGNCLYFSRSPVPFVRDCPPGDWPARHTFYRHHGIYVFRRDFLLRFASLGQTPLERAEKLEQLRILEHGYGIRAVVTEDESPAVDTPEDLERVRALLEGRHG